MLPQKRRRNYSQRSRTGCSTCRKRHVRCDEKKPACTNCLTGGRQCYYPDPFVTFGTSEPSSSEDEPSTVARISAEQLVSGYQPSVTELLDLTPRRSFTGFSLELPPVSRRLFHYFAQQRTPRMNHGGWQESAVVHKALANPGYFHASLIMASIHSIWMGASFDEIKPALQYHRLEACRFVSQQLHDPKKAKSEATVATIATLALLEACFFDCIGFDLRLLDTHIDGMQRALNYKPGKLKDNPLQSLTRMVVREIKKGPVMVQWVAFSKKHLPVVEGISYPQPLNPKWLTYPDTQWRSQASGLEWRAELGHIGKPEGVRYFEVRSQVAFIMSSLYMFVQIPWNVLSSYVLNWVIELFFGVIVKTEPGVFGNVSGYKSWDKQFGCGDSAAASSAPVPFDARNWFWMCIYCATAIESAIPRNKKEELQKELYRQAIYQNLRRVSDLLELKDWETATKVLQHVKWDSGFEGEARIRELWQEAALGQSPGTLSGET